ncbi:FmdB family zinc ribbon protein [Novipirellula artificiosorum]|uniref:Zinc ribbon domain protein n=1 Tax=Novipirellula artificiosorum TaxID=2528016 RepID=A0A5C6DJH7_9BACT|nr:zinc ribbon domain-containing protein [Novipirellula artificiosorum]TWU35059.1 Zinc ribbon domain protein [Novipirellula artificiosorum]
MPLYEYECKSCDKVIELLVRSQDELAECPQCGNTKMERQLSVTAAPSIKRSSSLPISGSGEACGMPRCCGGGCQM